MDPEEDSYSVGSCAFGGKSAPGNQYLNPFEEGYDEFHAQRKRRESEYHYEKNLAEAEEPGEQSNQHREALEAYLGYENVQTHCEQPMYNNNAGVVGPEINKRGYPIQYFSMQQGNNRAESNDQYYFEANMRQDGYNVENQGYDNGTQTTHSNTNISNNRAESNDRYYFEGNMGQDGYNVENQGYDNGTQTTHSNTNISLLTNLPGVTPPESMRGYRSLVMKTFSNSHKSELDTDASTVAGLFIDIVSSSSEHGVGSKHRSRSRQTHGVGSRQGSGSRQTYEVSYENSRRLPGRKSVAIQKDSGRSPGGRELYISTAQFENELPTCSTGTRPKTHINERNNFEFTDVPKSRVDYFENTHLQLETTCEQKHSESRFRAKTSVRSNTPSGRYRSISLSSYSSTSTMAACWVDPNKIEGYIPHVDSARNSRQNFEEKKRRNNLRSTSTEPMVSSDDMQEQELNWRAYARKVHHTSREKHEPVSRQPHEISGQNEHLQPKLTRTEYSPSSKRESSSASSSESRSEIRPSFRRNPIKFKGKRTALVTLKAYFEHANEVLGRNRSLKRLQLDHIEKALELMRDQLLKAERREQSYKRLVQKNNVERRRRKKRRLFEDDDESYKTFIVTESDQENLNASHLDAQNKKLQSYKDYIKKYTAEIERGVHVGEHSDESNQDNARPYDAKTTTSPKLNIFTETEYKPENENRKHNRHTREGLEVTEPAIKNDILPDFQAQAVHVYTITTTTQIPMAAVAKNSLPPAIRGERQRVRVRRRRAPKFRTFENVYRASSSEDAESSDESTDRNRRHIADKSHQNANISTRTSGPARNQYKKDNAAANKQKPQHLEVRSPRKPIKALNERAPQGTNADFNTFRESDVQHLPGSDLDQNEQNAPIRLSAGNEAIQNSFKNGEHLYSRYNTTFQRDIDYDQPERQSRGHNPIFREHNPLLMQSNIRTDENRRIPTQRQQTRIVNNYDGVPVRAYNAPASVTLSGLPPNRQNYYDDQKCHPDFDIFNERMVSRSPQRESSIDESVLSARMQVERELERLRKIQSSSSSSMANENMLPVQKNDVNEQIIQQNLTNISTKNPISAQPVVVNKSARNSQAKEAKFASDRIAVEEGIRRLHFESQIDKNEHIIQQNLTDIPPKYPTSAQPVVFNKSARNSQANHYNVAPERVAVEEDMRRLLLESQSDKNEHIIQQNLTNIPPKYSTSAQPVVVNKSARNSQANHYNVAPERVEVEEGIRRLHLESQIDKNEHIIQQNLTNIPPKYPTSAQPVVVNKSARNSQANHYNVAPERVAVEEDMRRLHLESQNDENLLAPNRFSYVKHPPQFIPVGEENSKLFSSLVGTEPVPLDASTMTPRIIKERLEECKEMERLLMDQLQKFKAQCEEEQLAGTQQQLNPTSKNSRTHCNCGRKLCETNVLIGRGLSASELVRRLKSKLAQVQGEGTSIYEPEVQHVTPDTLQQHPQSRTNEIFGSEQSLPKSVSKYLPQEQKETSDFQVTSVLVPSVHLETQQDSTSVQSLKYLEPLPQLRRNQSISPTRTTVSWPLCQNDRKFRSILRSDSDRRSKDVTIETKSNAAQEIDVEKKSSESQHKDSKAICFNPEVEVYQIVDPSSEDEILSNVDGFSETIEIMQSSSSYFSFDEEPESTNPFNTHFASQPIEELPYDENDFELVDEEITPRTIYYSCTENDDTPRNNVEFVQALLSHQKLAQNSTSSQATQFPAPCQPTAQRAVQNTSQRPLQHPAQLSAQYTSQSLGQRTDQRPVYPQSPTLNTGQSKNQEAQRPVHPQSPFVNTSQSKNQGAQHTVQRTVQYANQTQAEVSPQYPPTISAQNPTQRPPQVPILSLPRTPRQNLAQFPVQTPSPRTKTAPTKTSPQLPAQSLIKTNYLPARPLPAGIDTSGILPYPPPTLDELSIPSFMGCPCMHHIYLDLIEHVVAEERRYNFLHVHWYRSLKAKGIILSDLDD